MENWRKGVFAGGAWRDGRGAEFAVENPAEGEVVWRGPGASAEDVADAVGAAKATARDWALTPLEHRMKILRAYKDEVTRRKAELADIICVETGKPLWEAETEAGAVANKVEISIRAQEERTGVKELSTGAARAVLRHKPHGTLAVLGPFNFPAHLANGHMVPALLAGNTIVFKPSELAPGAGAFIVDAMRAAGVPDGVVNLVQGGRETGGALVDDPRIDGVLFTGGVRTGLFLHQKFAGQPQKVLALELGGNNPLIWWDTEDVEAAAYAVIQSAFLTSGQRCTCARRLIVPEGARGDFAVATLAAMTDRVRVARPKADPQPFMGSVISRHSAGNLHTAYQSLAGSGSVIRPMERLSDLGDAFVSPGIVDVTGAGELPDEEQFGPLLQVYRVADFDAAITRANATAFGLSAGLLSDDAEKWATFLALSHAGIVNWNRQITGASSAAPFGGIGLSGNHRPSAYYAADYCAYPVASTEADALEAMPDAPRGFRA